MTESGGAGSRELVQSFMARLAVPGGTSDALSDVSQSTLKRSASESSSALVDAIIAQGYAKRSRFGPVEGIDAFTSTLTAGLAESLDTIDTGLSTMEAQTDEIIRQSVFAKRTAEAWEADYVEGMPLFGSRRDADTYGRNFTTVASIPVLNFVLELACIRANAMLLDPTLKQRLSLDSYTLRTLAVTQADKFDDAWNYLGPMSSHQTFAPHAGDARVRASARGERQLTFSTWNRAPTKNVFGAQLKPGSYLFYQISYTNTAAQSPVLLDPRGNGIAARTGRDDQRALQVTGGSSFHVHTASGNTSYDPVTGPESFTDPADGDADYLARVTKMVSDYTELEIDEFTGRATWRKVHDADAINEGVRMVPELVYNAYMEGEVRKAGYYFGDSITHDSAQAIADGHRSHDKQKMLTDLKVVYL